MNYLTKALRFLNDIPTEAYEQRIAPPRQVDLNSPQPTENGSPTSEGKGSREDLPALSLRANQRLNQADQIYIEVGSRTSTEYILIEKREDLINATAKFEKAESIALDTETTGLDPFTGKIRLIQMAIPDHPVMILDLFKINPGDLTPLVELFQSPMEKVLQNAKFDLKMLKMAGIPIEGNLFDTMIAAQLLGSGLKAKGFRLSEIAKEYLDESLPKEEQMSDWSGELSSTQFEYAARDAQILLRIKDVLQKKLVQENLEKVALLEFGCVPAVAEMELNGMLLDLEKWNNLGEELNASQGKLEAILHGELGGINLNSHVQLLRTLKARGIPIENTSRETLSLWVDKNPVLKQVLDYRRVAKACGLASNLPQHIHPLTGRLHPDYRQIGAETGRFSCQDPNLQNIPREKMFRMCFVPASGFNLVIGDYSQIELRIAAEISQDTRMIEAYNRDEDLHTLTASIITNKPMDQVTKEERQAAKAVNFGLIYGMGAKGLRIYAQNQYGVIMTDREARSFREKFFKAYRGISTWHRNSKFSNSLETRTLIGRRRKWHEPPPLTKLLNTPVQGTAADITKRAMSLLLAVLKNTGVKIIGCVHDEIILECPIDKSQELSSRLKEIMEKSGGEFLEKIPVKAEVVIANNWADK